MTPQEKLAQMNKLFPFVNAITKRLPEARFKTLKRASRFPAFLFVKDNDISGMGKWTIVVVADSKSDACKGRYACLAFQTFFVRHSKNPSNNGTGVYLLHHQQSVGAWCCEIPPHYFNRVRERLIKPKGIVQPDFDGLMREVLRMHHHCMHVIHEGTVIEKGEDGKYDVVKTKENTRVEGYDNFASYHDGGISLGLSVDRRYFLYTTFVSNDLLRNGQQAFQEQYIREAKDHELRLRTDPKDIFMKEEFVDNVDF